MTVWLKKNIINNLLLFGFIVIVGLTAADTANAKEFTFDPTYWGASMIEIQYLEPLPLLKKKINALIYQGTMAGLPAFISFQFENDRLIRCICVIDTLYDQPSAYISDYETIKNSMVVQYGKPDADLVSWKDKTYRNQPQMHAQAMVMGHVTFYTSWVFGVTEITAIMNGSDQEIKHVIEFERSQGVQ
ncbi:MAG: hypothetical protein QNI92_14965 [Desulfobacterales bacterium]|nr:hypothetical protein [Desulfobacterales bacterium]